MQPDRLDSGVNFRCIGHTYLFLRYAEPAVKDKGLRAMIEDRWLSVDEIAEYLRVKRDTVYKWIDRKGMPAHKAGRLWKFKRDEVDAWVRNGSRRGDAEDPDQ